MRNLIEYPITYEEADDFLEKLKHEYMAEGLVGDMRPVLIAHIQERLWIDNDMRNS